MNFKLLSLILLTIIFLYNLLLEFLQYRSSRNPIPDNVKDVYDEETYLRWLAYHGEKSRMSIVSTVISYLVNLAIILFDFYAVLVRGIDNVYLQTIVVLAVFNAVDLIATVVFSYIDTMIIDEKYGFNKTTVKTFCVDRLKEFLISLVLVIGLMCLFVWIHQSLGDWILVLFSGILIGLVVMLMVLYPTFSKVFNKFTPLEDGELKDKLTALLEKYGYTIKGIQVMNASERTTKSNAYFSGAGKTKTIVLYDNLVETMTPDEICAVFAHELGHGLHKDTQKNSINSFVMVVILVVLAWLTVRCPEIYADFGFAGVNYGFALILLMVVEFAFISPLLGLWTNAVSRKAEYRADAQAVKDGYGEELVSALKKLSRENFVNLAPHKLLVALEYSHPTLSQRIEAIGKLRQNS